MKETLFVSFSGGRTSAYMCWYLLTYWSHKYNFIFVFANTGLEHEETLIFVDRCDKEMSLNLAWLEAVVHYNEEKGCTHKIVDFTTAARKGEPFEAVIKKYGIPNPDFPHCNRELKLNPIFSFKRSLGYKSNHDTALGIRVDEMDRQRKDAKKAGIQYPLISKKPTTKPEVRHWWNDHGFDLMLDEHEGNCVTCWKKSDRKLMTVAKHEPWYFDFFARMERENGFCGAESSLHRPYLKEWQTVINKSGDSEMKEVTIAYEIKRTPRVFYRKYRNAQDIIASSKQPFVEYKDYLPELQLTLDIDPLDLQEDCGGSCEAG